jgi:hypothetical protein
MAKVKDPVLKRYEKAKDARLKFDSLLEDCYIYTSPGPSPRFGAELNSGEKKDAVIYSDTAVQALTKRVFRAMGQLFPAGEKFIELDFGNFDLDALPPDQRETARLHLDRAERSLHAAFDASNFQMEIPQALRDVFISTGCLQFNEGDLESPFTFEVVPISQFVPEESTRGIIETVYRPRKPARRDVPILWPKADLPKEFTEKLAKEPDEKIDLLEAQIFDPEKGDYRYLVYLAEGEKLIFETRYKTKPIIAFRLDKHTGEIMGRGPVTKCRANILTANKVVELVLKNASIAVTGIWQADDDGVLNPANIRLVPGVIIPKAVGSAGLTPLQAPGRFDVSQLVLESLNGAIRESIEGPPLPPLAGDRRTAYEFSAREREQAEVEVPSHLRLFYELDWHLIMRALDILSGPRFIGSRFYIEPLLVNGQKLLPKPASPLIKLRAQAEIMRSQRGILSAGAISPEITSKLVKLEDFLRRFLLVHGLLPEEIYTPQELAQQAEAAQQAQSQAAMMQGLGSGAEAGAALAGGDLTGAVEAVAKLGGQNA